MGHERYTKEEIAARAKALYEEKIRARVERENAGKYLVIDVETGDYEVDQDQRAASERARRKHPGAALFGMRIGYQAWGRIGSGRLAAES